jgi:hypothetical protein
MTVDHNHHALDRRELGPGAALGNTVEVKERTPGHVKPSD